MLLQLSNLGCGVMEVHCSALCGSQHLEEGVRSVDCINSASVNCISNEKETLLKFDIWALFNQIRSVFNWHISPCVEAGSNRLGNWGSFTGVGGQA